MAVSRMVIRVREKWLRATSSGFCLYIDLVDACYRAYVGRWNVHIFRC